MYMFPRYWPHVPANLDSVSVDIYCHYSGGLCSSSACPGGPSEICEVTSARDYYEQYIFPKLGPKQRGKFKQAAVACDRWADVDRLRVLTVWLVPGLFAAIKTAPSYAASLAISVSKFTSNLCLREEG